MQSVLLGVAAVAVVFVLGRGLFARLSRRAPPRRAERAGGRLVLRSRGLFVAIGLTALPPIAVVAALAWLLARREQISAGGIAFAELVVAAGLALVAWVFAAAARQRIVADDLGVERIGVLRRRRLRWVDVARLAYNPVSRTLLLAGPAARLWISEDLGGIGEFAALALARLPPALLEASADVREVLEELVEEGRA
jgi:hypothetical protein